MTRNELRKTLLALIALSVALAVPAGALEIEGPVQPNDLLSRIRASLSVQLERQPNCTCRQTLDRSQRESRTSGFRDLDTLNFEVALIRGHEMFSLPAAGEFQTRNIRQLAPAGSTSIGSFASHARNVFFSEGAVYRFMGVENLNGRRCFRYRYEVPKATSNYVVTARGESAVVGARGSFWADAGTLDVVRLEVNAREVPKQMRLLSVKEVMDYSRVRIRENEFLLPTKSETSAVLVSGQAVRLEKKLSGCRQYVVDSAISFDVRPPVETEPVAGEGAGIKLPGEPSPSRPFPR